MTPRMAAHHAALFEVLLLLPPLQRLKWLETQRERLLDMPELEPGAREASIEALGHLIEVCGRFDL